MNIIDWLLLDPFKHDLLFTAIVMFGEDHINDAINMGLIVADGINVRINVQ